MKVANIGFAEFAQRLRGQQPNIRAFFLFGKMWIIGALLFFPGYLTDILAVGVWLLGIGGGGGSDSGGGGGSGGNRGVDDGVIEVEGGFVDDEAIEDKRQ